MVGSIKIRVHAHNPSLPLTEAVSYIGSPSSVFVYDVPKKIGTWQITDVAVSVYYPDNSFATVAARMSAAGVWVATIPACDLSGRIRNGFRILASGIDEDGEPVSGYVLGVGDLAVCKLFPAPAPDPGEKAYILRYFNTAPESPKKGDVAKFDDVIKFYDGTEWVPFGSEVDLSDYYTKEETDALFDDYYTAEETDEAIDRLAAYYITYNAAGAAFPTRAALLNAQTVYSGGVVRTPTRNDYAVVLADETHDGAEYRYIYAVADGETVGQWEAQYPIETNDYTALANKPTINNVEVIGDKSGGDYGLANETTPVVTEAEVPASCYPISYSYGLAYVLGPSDIDIQIRQGNIYLSDKTHAMQYLCMFNAQNGVFRSASSSLGSTLRFNGTAPVADSWPVLDVTATGGTVVRSAEFAGALNKKQNTLTFDNTPTAGSNNPVKSGGIWTAIWGALAALPTGFSSLYDWCVDQLAGKLAKSGGTAADITFAAYNAHTVEVSPGPTAAGTTATLDFRDPATDYTVSLIIGQGGQVAIKHGNITEGNIPEFDSQKRLVDSGKTVGDLERYALGETITASATLADRTMNKVEPLATNTDDIELSFPPATSGKARDFLVLINNPTGNTGAITFDPPAGAMIYGDGLTQTFAAGETWEVTITEVATKQFLCKALKVEGVQVPYVTQFEVTTSGNNMTAGIYSATAIDSTIPTVVKWGDGNTDSVTGDISQLTHTYSAEGTYVVTISDNISSLSISGQGTWGYSTTKNQCVITKVITLSPSISSIPTNGLGYLQYLNELNAGEAGLLTLATSAVHSTGSMSPTGIKMDFSGRTISEIPKRCFDGATRITEFKWPKGLTKIGEEAFYSAFTGQMALDTLVIPEGVTTLGSGIFALRDRIKSLTFPASLTSFGYIGLTYLESLICRGTTATYAPSYAFGNGVNYYYTGESVRSAGNNRLYVPAGATGYDSGGWLDPLQNSTKCGFTKVEV